MRKYIFKFCSNIKPPMNPTMAESFGTKISKQDLEKYINPIGFLDEKDKKEYILNESEKKQENVQKELKDEQKTDEKKEEYGFQIKGPEPTRFGDWERKGRCTDF